MPIDRQESIHAPVRPCVEREKLCGGPAPLFQPLSEGGGEGGGGEDSQRSLEQHSPKDNLTNHGFNGFVIPAINVLYNM